MKNLGKNPAFWFTTTLVIGWWVIRTDDFQMFVVLAFAFVLSKQIEMIHKKEGDRDV